MLSKDLHRCASEAYVGQLGALREALGRVWARYYPLDDGKDVAFELGFVYYAMRRYREALDFYGRSLARYGPHRVTLFNMGLCEFQQGRMDEALRLFERSLEVDPTYGPARDWRVRVLAERGAEGGEPPSARGSDGPAGA
jgi:tetratricopeptide (TPR) repeat protein